MLYCVCNRTFNVLLGLSTLSKPSYTVSDIWTIRIRTDRIESEMIVFVSESAAFNSILFAYFGTFPTGFLHFSSSFLFLIIVRMGTTTLIRRGFDANIHVKSMIDSISSCELGAILGVWNLQRGTRIIDVPSRKMVRGPARFHQLDIEPTSKWISRGDLRCIHVASTWLFPWAAWNN